MEPHLTVSASSKPRRSHRKSRNGCLECKKRHIRCDEGRPQCSHCVKGERKCFFPQKSPIIKPYASPPESDGVESQPAPACADNTEHHVGPTYSIIHMTLLHHANCHMKSFMGIQGQMRPGINIAVESASTATYLLDQLLALSALHLSTVDPSKAKLYHYEATELQTRALSHFNEAKEEISESNCVPLFLFGSLLGIHVLRETLANVQANLATFLSSFCRYARLHRGVRFVTSAYWDVIHQSSLKPLLHVKTLSEEVEKHRSGTETKQFADFLESAKGDPSSITACREALKYIQWVLDISKLEATNMDTGAHGTMAWPLVVPPEYFDVLAQRQPEALVVFAFYVAILHRYRQFWVFADAGAVLVPMVVNELGADWQEHLKWPLQVLNEDWDRCKCC